MSDCKCSNELSRHFLQQKKVHSRNLEHHQRSNEQQKIALQANKMQKHSAGAGAGDVAEQLYSDMSLKSMQLPHGKEDGKPSKQHKLTPRSTLRQTIAEAMGRQSSAMEPKAMRQKELKPPQQARKFAKCKHDDDVHVTDCSQTTASNRSSRATSSEMLRRQVKAQCKELRRREQEQRRCEEEQRCREEEQHRECAQRRRMEAQRRHEEAQHHRQCEQRRHEQVQHSKNEQLQSISKQAQYSYSRSASAQAAHSCSCSHCYVPPAAECTSQCCSSHRPAAAAAAPLTQNEAEKIHNINQVLFNKIVTPMMRRMQNIYMHNMREEMYLMQDIECLPEKVTDVYLASKSKRHP